MENKEKLYDFYDKILNCLVINTKSIARQKNRKGYYIPDFSFDNKESLLLIEIVKIVNLLEGKNVLPILLQVYNIKTFINYIRLKYNLRKTCAKVKIAKKEDINNDFNENLIFVSEELNFPKVIYEEIYEAFYEKGAEVNA